MKDRFILAGRDGRPSTKLAFSTMSSDSTLFHKREMNGRITYRGFKDRQRLLENIQTGVKYLSEWRQPSLTLDDAIVVRWGTREVLPANSGTVMYNRAGQLVNATNKKLSRQLFIEHGINAPKLIQAGVMTTNQNHSDFPLIARPNTHSKGRNFIILNTEDDFFAHWNIHNRDWYYSAFVDKDREFRVHVAHGKVLAVMGKERPRDGTIAWNRARNTTDPFFYINWNRLDEGGIKPAIVESIKAVEAVGLDFGGVDVMMKEDTAYVLEVNTAPTLNTSPYVASKWGMYFDWLFREEIRRPHWEDVINRRYAKSMLWKNYQLRDETE